MGGDCSVAEELRLFLLSDLGTVSDAGWVTGLDRSGGVCSGLCSSVGGGGGCRLDAAGGTLLKWRLCLGTFGSIAMHSHHLFVVIPQYAILQSLSNRKMICLSLSGPLQKLTKIP